MTGDADVWRRRLLTPWLIFVVALGLIAVAGTLRRRAETGGREVV